MWQKRNGFSANRLLNATSQKNKWEGQIENIENLFGGWKLKNNIYLFLVLAAMTTAKENKEN